MSKCKALLNEKHIKKLGEIMQESKQEAAGGKLGVCVPFARSASNYLRENGFKVTIVEGSLYALNMGSKPIEQSGEDYQKYGHFWVEARKNKQSIHLDLTEWDNKPFIAKAESQCITNTRPMPKNKFIWKNVDEWGYDPDDAFDMEKPEQRKRFKKTIQDYGYSKLDKER